MPSELKKRTSSGLAAWTDDQLRSALEKRAKATGKPSTKKVTGMRAFVGYSLLGVWVLFIVAEYFHLVVHQNTVGHWVLQTAPLAVGLAMVAPDVIDKLQELAMWVVSLLARIRKIKIVLPKDDNLKGE